MTRRILIRNSLPASRGILQLMGQGRLPATYSPADSQTNTTSITFVNSYSQLRSTLRNFAASWASILLHSMAARDVTVAIRNNNRILFASITVVTVCLVARWTSDLVGLSVRPKRSSLSKANQSGTLRFVSMCSSNFDGRRLGNQLFNWAAMLYVARLTGRF